MSLDLLVNIVLLSLILTMGFFYGYLSCKHIIKPNIEPTHKYKPISLKSFKVGDRVKLVTHGCIDWESEEWTKKGKLKIGNSYTIVYVSTGHERAVSVKGCIMFLHPDHFIKVPKVYKVKV